MIRIFSYLKVINVKTHTNNYYFCHRKIVDYRGVAQLVAYYVRDVGAGSSSLLTPTNEKAFPRKRKGLIFPGL
jgi:hypothetical protein